MKTHLLRLAVLVLPVACAGATPAALVQGPEKKTTTPVVESVDFDHSHTLFTEVLAKHVQKDRFDYAELLKNREPLDRYLRSLEAVKADQLAGWTDKQRYAFWINAYNAYTLQIVVDNYPVKSIKDIGSLGSSVWDKAFIPLNPLHPEGKDERLSLNHIEHSILRPRFKDARVHAAVNCASRGCPVLLGEAFVADKLDAQLDAQVRAWMADESRNKFNVRRGTVHLSKIFSWFREDFTRDDDHVLKWVAKYAPSEVADYLKRTAPVLIKVKHLDYSWKLNDVERKAGQGS